MAKKTYILDTSVYLTDAGALTSYQNNDIVVPFKVLEEVDNHKKRQDGVGTNARNFIRKLDSLRDKGSLHSGVRIAKGKGVLYVSSPENSQLDMSVADNEIIATALDQKNKNPRRKVVVVSRDINMRVKCDALGLITEDYIVGQVVKNTENLYSGYETHLVDDQIIDQFYAGEDIYLEKEDIKLYQNHFVLLVSSANGKKTALARFYDYSKPLKRINGEYKQGIWGVKPRNKEQNFCLNLLMDPDVKVVTLVGKAGSGKTLLAIASGLAQVVDNANSPYRRLIVSRPIQPLGKDIGHLPGTMEEKMTPWLAPIQDNLRYLMGNDKETLAMYISQGTIEIEALTYIRGRSISNAYIIIDEAQNLTAHELKTIITRVGENTKVVLTGDIDQIDNVYVDETSNGLAYAVEKFKSHDISGHVTLVKGERSKVATLAAKIL